MNLEMNKMLEANGITYAYGRKRVLTGASLSAVQGQCVGIAGANGCGKSTFLGIISGTLRPQGGCLNIMGKDAFSDRKMFGRYIGYVPQENPLIEELSVMDNLRLWYGSRARVREAMATGFLSILNLKDLLGVSAGKLSGGQKKRLNIGCAMAWEPPLLIMDEPGAALDIVCKEEIREYLKIYLAHGGTIVMATHDSAELDICGRLYVMRDGSLSEVDPGLRGRELVNAFMC